MGEPEVKKFQQFSRRRFVNRAALLLAQTAVTAGLMAGCADNSPSPNPPITPGKPPKYPVFWPVGDSKTVGQGDNNPPGEGLNGYPPLLKNLLAVATGQDWTEMPRTAASGISTSGIRNRIDDDLLKATHTPDFVLINLGVNDLNIGLTQARFETDYGYILEAIHARFPSARIYLARIWTIRHNGSTALANLNDVWIPNVLSERPWAYPGIDERTFLPGPDNGGSNTVDGVHPNRAGYMLTALNWKKVMGY